MLTSYATGLLAIVLVSVAWVAIQLAWRRAFPDASADPDVLAGRIGCHACNCTEPCERRRGEEEET